MTTTPAPRMRQIRRILGQRLLSPGGTIFRDGGNRQICMLRGGICAQHLVTEGFRYNHELSTVTPPDLRKMRWWR